MLNLKIAGILACLIVIVLISGCVKSVPRPYEAQINVAPAATRPLQSFPELPLIQSDGNRDVCAMHHYRVELEYVLCSEYKRTSNLIENLTDHRQKFSIPSECKAINDGVKKGLHKACVIQ